MSKLTNEKTTDEIVKTEKLYNPDLESGLLEKLSEIEEEEDDDL